MGFVMTIGCQWGCSVIIGGGLRLEYRGAEFSRLPRALAPPGGGLGKDQGARKTLPDEGMRALAGGITVLY